MKRIITITLLLTCLLSSCDYLDKRDSTDGYTLEEVFGNETNFDLYVDWMVQNPIIKYLQNGLVPFGTYDDVTDNSMSSATFPVAGTRAAQGDYWSMINHGWCPMSNMDTWNRAWKYVRISNMGLKYIDMYPGDEKGKNKLMGTCYFFRAFAYFELCRRWGGMPYFTEPFTDLAANLDRERLDMRTTYLNIAEDFQKASEYLEPVIDATEWQHPTSVAALGFKSRALLYAASEQATTEGGKTRDDVWKDAVAAACDAIASAESNGYGLAAGSDYYSLFKGLNSDIYTKEVLFGRRAQIAWGSDAYKGTIRPPGKLSGLYGVGANQTFVDCYDMANGYPTSDPESGYNPQNPYINRGSRFEHDIMYNQKKVFGNKLMNLYNQQEAANGSISLGGGDIKYDAGSVSAGYTRTGTYVMKWMGDQWNTALPMVWPYIRMAELYLNYAEAAAEAGLDIKSVDSKCGYSPLQALNKIRQRAGIADLPESYQVSGKFLERVRNERRVELSFEEHRLFDIRRWKIATKTDQNIYGCVITKLAAGYDKAAYPTGFKYDYTKTIVLRRTFENKHYLFPINRDDTYIGPLFKQNEGW